MLQFGFKNQKKESQCHLSISPKKTAHPTLAQKRELIAGVTNILAEVLGKNKASTVVIIDEIDTDNYGLGGTTITEVQKRVKNSANGVETK